MTTKRKGCHVGHCAHSVTSKDSLELLVIASHGQGGKGPTKLVRKMAESIILAESGTSQRKKTERLVHTLHSHHKSPIQAQDGTDPGSAVQIKSIDDARSRSILGSTKE